MFSIKLANSLGINEQEQASGNLLIELDGKQFGHSIYETTSIPYTLSSLKNYKKNEVYGISKIELIHSAKELYLRIFEKTIQLITYVRNNREEIELISEEIPIEVYEKAVKQLELSYYELYLMKNKISTI